MLDIEVRISIQETQGARRRKLVDIVEGLEGEDLNVVVDLHHILTVAQQRAVAAVSK